MLTSLDAFLLVGGTAFYLILALYVVLLLAFTAGDGFAGAFWITVAFLVALQFLSDADPFTWMANHPWHVAGTLLAYFPVGVGWALFRWGGYVAGKAEVLAGSKHNFNVGIYRSRTWEEYVAAELPKASLHKDRICFWIAYWPSSLAVYLLSDFLTELARRVYSLIGGMFDRVVERQKRKIL